MWQPNPSALAAHLSEQFGLGVLGAAGRDPDGHPFLELRPEGVHRHDGFCIRVELGWRSVKARFVPGPFAGELIDEMGRAAPQNRGVFADLVQRCVEDGGAISMSVNGNPVDPADPGTWPISWQKIDLLLEKSPVAVNTEDGDENDRQLNIWSRKFTGMVLALLPLETLEEPVDSNPDGLPEGACIRVEVNRYERSRVNRANCLEIHGTSCKACGFNFGQTYGPLAEGFIHVHHTVPVSELGGSYIVDPVRDLVPLCPNCHAIAHLRKPPLQLSELKHLLRTRGVEPAGEPARVAVNSEVGTFK
ncbi:HNH endonuclease [Pseudorhodoplanes sp.]|uniref:HNH endonuclease n=1 Tax=Pseudorhodoplanes sp. TaxID=1934341 RepID=UPI003918E810